MTATVPISGVGPTADGRVSTALSDPAVAVTMVATPHQANDIVILPYRDSVGEVGDSVVGTGIDQIFFEASSVQAFRDVAHQKSFRWLWLGRYLAEEPEHGFVALACDSHGRRGVAGYLVGSLADPARRTAFNELDYLSAFSDQTALYPAHLHVNVANGMRGAGIGAKLVAAFEDHAGANGTRGIHLVTGAGMRNVRFYDRLGYGEVARAMRGGGHVVMLAKRLR